MKAKEGDWVRFYQNGKMVIGVVQYITQRRTAPWVEEAMTDTGVCDLDYILEVRSKKEEQP